MRANRFLSANQSTGRDSGDSRRDSGSRRCRLRASSRGRNICMAARCLIGNENNDAKDA